MTDEWHLEPTVARVVAWHNRHPLARRITPQQVQSLGFVAMPLAANTAAFSEDFIAPLSPARVARWAACHAREAAAAPTGGPLKQVAVDDARVAAGTAVVTRYAMTAAVQSAGRRTRLLLGPDLHAPVLGRRLWSRPRAAAAGTGVLAALCLLVMGIALPAAVPVPSGAEPPALAAAVPPDAGGPLEPTPPQRESPPDAEPRLGRIELPPPLPAIGGAMRDAARQAQAGGQPAPDVAAQAAAPWPPPGTAQTAETAMPLPDEAAEAVPAVAAVPTEAFWAVTTRLLRTRAESLQWLRAVDELLREQGSTKLQVELLPEGDDWRVVGWPFTRRADAERARALLLARGLKVEVVDF
jgi:hypothetical protein